MGLRDTYAHAIATAKGKFHGGAEERDGKLYWKGTVANTAIRDEIWNAIKTVPSWRDDIVADITVTGDEAAAPAESRTYTVQPGDTLSGIAKAQLGKASDYMKIFELNKDQLSDPDKIKPGQILRLP